ncbi:hypothetical protein [Gayadomonas joobiniege]|uniref:hypothetical protein n=1 Tax=Gayadomonas joobiniege TaxID=1234606 RepID=UPI0003807C63|nr:hypothetical protein [Gayadomonas joobiniege]
MIRPPVFPAIANAISMVKGHCRFLDKNTGDTDNPKTDFYVINNQGVLANNRHFISDTRMEYQPNGDATTEGQSILILGFIHMYKATGQKFYLYEAQKYWQAYVDKFYTEPVPNTPKRWICNWIINGKEPVLANYPLNPGEPTQGGFKGIEFTFSNGQTVIPHGAPHYGEYLDIATFAFKGALAWDAINASVKEVLPDGTVNWDGDGTEYPVDWIIAWTGNKIDSDGNVVSTGHAEAEKGTVQLKDTSLNGVYKLNYATRNPVSEGGYLIARNEHQHNRPLHVPLLGGASQRGNAADAELWFADCCYMLHQITNDSIYRKALESVMFTINEYTLIDALDQFFRRSFIANTPWTDGISYDYNYPDFGIEFSREDGYIKIECDGAGVHYMEQQSIRFRINTDSVIRTNIYGKDVSNNSLIVYVELIMSDTKEGTGTYYYADIPNVPTDEVGTYDIPITSFTRTKRDDGEPYLTAAALGFTEYGSVTYQKQYETDIIEIGRNANAMAATLPDGDAGFIVGFWNTTTELAPLNSIVYKSDGEFDLRFEDADGWRWYWILPNTNNTWSQRTLNSSNLIFSGYQPNAAGRPDPASPNYSDLDQFTILNEVYSDTNLTFTIYCVNDMPPRYSKDDGYTQYYTVATEAQDAFTYYLGDCTVIGFRNDGLAYTPGLIPFSNAYIEGSHQFGAWRGLPYPGYQVPHLFTLGLVDEEDRKLNNVIDFLYDSQQWYFNEFNVLGPSAQAYIWNRWDNVTYGPPDTFVMYHFDNQEAWSGYEPRAFSWAARCWQEMAAQGKVIPQKLIDYCENWMTFLIDFYVNHEVTPTYFPKSEAPQPVQDDFTGHMTGLWLSGACLCALAGYRHDKLDAFINGCMKELTDNYELIDKDNPMNGSWSPWAGGGMFFGFWTGEILKGLATFIQYKREIKR